MAIPPAERAVGDVGPVGGIGTCRKKQGGGSWSMSSQWRFSLSRWAYPPLSSPPCSARISTSTDRELLAACADLERRRPIARDQSRLDRKGTRLNSSHQIISYAVFCLKKKIRKMYTHERSARTIC